MSCKYDHFKFHFDSKSLSYFLVPIAIFMDAYYFQPILEKKPIYLEIQTKSNPNYMVWNFYFEFQTYSQLDVGCDICCTHYLKQTPPHQPQRHLYLSHDGVICLWIHDPWLLLVVAHTYPLPFACLALLIFQFIHPYS